MRKLILTGIVACSLLLMQSCSKKESLTGIKTTAITSSKLKVRDVYISGTVPTGTYKITTGTTINATNKTMGVAASLTTGANVQQLDYTASTGSDWRITDLGNGYYSIINTFSNQALTLGDGSVPEHLQVIQYGYGGIDAQQWKIEYQGAFGTYRIRCKLNLNKGAYVDPSSTASGTNIKIETYPPGDANAGFFYFSHVAVPYQDNVATGLFKRDYTTGWNNGDGSHSVQLADGRILWTMDDSSYDSWTSANGGTVACPYPQVNNAVMVQAAGNWSPASVLSYKGAQPAGGGLPSFYQYGPNPVSHYMWVADGVQIGNNTYMYCNVRSGNNEVGPPQLAKITLTAGQAPSSATVTYTNLQANLASDANGGVNFGRSFNKDGSWIYVYGTKSIDAFSANLLIARFANSDAGITGTWSFYKGGDYTLAASWSSDITQAVSISTRTTTGISITKVNSKYVLLSSQLAYFCGTDSRSIYSCTSSSPVGPFNTDKVVYNISDGTHSGNSAFWYGVIVHPEFTANNELLITYNKNGYLCDSTLCSGGRTSPEPYRPRAVRIPFSVIDPAL